MSVSVSAHALSVEDDPFLSPTGADAVTDALQYFSDAGVRCVGLVAGDLSTGSPGDDDVQGPLPATVVLECARSALEALPAAAFTALALSRPVNDATVTISTAVSAPFVAHS